MRCPEEEGVAVRAWFRDERLQIGKNKRDDCEECFRDPTGALLGQPIFARDWLQMSDEINKHHHDDRENIRRREG